MTGEIFLEIYPVDKAIRVTAIDSQTGTEVVFAAPAATARERIEDLARNKLAARLARERAAASANPSAPAPGAGGSGAAAALGAHGSGRGKLV